MHSTCHPAWDAFGLFLDDQEPWPAALTAIAEATGARGIRLAGQSPQSEFLFEFCSTWAPGTDAPDQLLSVSVHRDERLSVTLTASFPNESDRPALQRLRSMLEPEVRRQAAQESRMAALAASVAEGLDETVIFCDRAGRVVSASRNALGLLTAGDHLSLRMGRLQATGVAQDLQLQRVLREQAEFGDLLVLRNERGIPVRVDISPVQPSGPFGLGPCVAVAVRAGGLRRRRRLGLTHLGLTNAEAAVAAGVVEGLSPREMALARGVTADTVRMQLKSVFNKLHVRRQSQLAAALRHLV